VFHLLFINKGFFFFGPIQAGPISRFSHPLLFFLGAGFQEGNSEPNDPARVTFASPHNSSIELSVQLGGKAVSSL
jgi:hypothetical protein